MPTPWDKDLATATSEPTLMKPKNLRLRVDFDTSQVGLDMDMIIVIDLRGADYKGGIISNALHIPAEDFDNCMMTVVKIIAAANVSEVCFCDASSDGRAKRMGGNFQDFNNIIGAGNVTTYELEGGMEAWVAGGEDYTRLLVDYDPAVWEKQI
ncbi:hypothetical protein ZTR_02833 [Talaromyces verruculosus]|nr:hypothetical protein ZTR_02833 [Talaromyces verruculosus]